MESSFSYKCYIFCLFFKVYFRCINLFIRVYYNEKNVIISFYKNFKDLKFYKDNLCLFRCLEYYKLNFFCDVFEICVKKCFEIWCEFMFEKEIYDV